MAKDKWQTRVGGVRFDLPELEILSSLASSDYFPAMMRTFYKVLKWHKDLSFKLKEDDPDFVHKHRSYVEQSYGIRSFLKLIEEAPKRIQEKEESDSKV